MAQIEFKNVYKRFSEKRVALYDVNFKVEKGDFVFLVGKTGAGKTTILRHIYMELFPDEGSVLWEGVSTRKMRKSEILKVRRKMGIIFQDLKLLLNRTVSENIEFVLRLSGEKEVKPRIWQVLHNVGIVGEAQVVAGELSRGELQRLAVARAIVTNPEILLADEPFGNINKDDAIEILKILMDFNSSGSTVIIATHNVELLEEVKKKRVIEIDEGRIINEY
ncbi:MAG TPA: ATP-binding cassette domain-containing protein [candidate division WOR-3 bacterium]|uniref:ATP-binding cassette domain-containing protein n=1 Tax=candidate division WOR-3 bacterium TaxID=2052148 RepID=A0A7V5LUC2_UNCW3|nr:ATP-binding cassette domain-containing protein [candidate division WOR-3 bacterium]